MLWQNNYWRKTAQLKLHSNDGPAMFPESANREASSLFERELIECKPPKWYARSLGSLIDNVMLPVNSRSTNQDQWAQSVEFPNSVCTSNVFRVHIDLNRCAHGKYRCEKVQFGVHIDIIRVHTHLKSMLVLSMWSRENWLFLLLCHDRTVTGLRWAYSNLQLVCPFGLPKVYRLP